MQGYIYRMKVENDDKEYIGSTFGDIYKRFRVHKNNVKNRLNKTYEYLSDKIDGDLTKLKCELIDTKYCENRHDLHLKEYENIQKLISEKGRDKCLNIKFVNKPISIGNVKMVDNIREYNRNYYHSKNKENLLKKLNCAQCNIDISSINWRKHVVTPKHIHNSIKHEHDRIEILDDDFIEH
jgi:hypothetical protein